MPTLSLCSLKSANWQQWTDLRTVWASSKLPEMERKRTEKETQRMIEGKRGRKEETEMEKMKDRKRNRMEKEGHKKRHRDGEKDRHRMRNRMERKGA
jgi:hypothetical protein